MQRHSFTPRRCTSNSRRKICKNMLWPLALWSATKCIIKYISSLKRQIQWWLIACSVNRARVSKQVKGKDHLGAKVWTFVSHSSVVAFWFHINGWTTNYFRRKKKRNYRDICTALKSDVLQERCNLHADETLAYLHVGENKYVYVLLQDIFIHSVW